MLAPLLHRAVNLHPPRLLYLLQRPSTTNPAQTGPERWRPCRRAAEIADERRDRWPRGNRSCRKRKGAQQKGHCGCLSAELQFESCNRDDVPQLFQKSRIT